MTLREILAICGLITIACLVFLWLGWNLRDDVFERDFICTASNESGCVRYEKK